MNHSPSRQIILLRALRDAAEPIMSDEQLISLMHGSTCSMSRGWWRAAITRAKTSRYIFRSMAGRMLVSPYGLAMLERAEASAPQTRNPNPETLSAAEAATT